MKIENLKLLMDDLSLKEKIGQLMQLDASCFSDEGPVTGPEKELGIPVEELTLAGSILGATGAEITKELQKLYMEKQPHHIPLLFMADVINGYKTVFPIPLALGCSFSEEDAKITGEVMAKEAASAGLHITFAPMVDLVRDARWGRVMESTGEDPYINSIMAAAMVQGIQGNDPGYSGRIGACVKHFAAYGAPTAGKEYAAVELSTRTLYEDYLPAYKAAIDAGAAMMMTSFNTLERIPVTGNRWLMRDVLRKEMGFEGVLVSDYNAIGELITHGMARDKVEAAKLAIGAGVDMDMMSGCYMVALKKLVETGAVEEKLIDEAVWRILMLKNQMGLFEDPYRGVSAKQEKITLLKPEFRKQAKKVAVDTMVLLKNDDEFLPLSKNDEVAFIGPYIEEKKIIGSWSFFADAADSVTIREGVESKTNCAKYAPGCEILNPRETSYGFRYNVMARHSKEQVEKMMKDAVRLAEKNHKVILTLGELNLQTGEGGSRADITIPDIQKELLDRIYQVNQNIAVIIFSGRPLDIRDIEAKAKSILYAWFPGSEGGNAVADILYGDASPQARLSMSLPYCVGQVPVFYSEFKTGRHIEDGVEIENRFLSRYADIPNSPLYPFGYGLTYTKFAYSDIRLDKTKLNAGETITAEVDVENIGSRTATETVQLYITDNVGSVVRPVRELKGYQKVMLKPGQMKTISFEITADMLRFYNINMDYQYEKGEFVVWIGADSTTQNGINFELI